jgi:hypothetical protein
VRSTLGLYRAPPPVRTAPVFAFAMSSTPAAWTVRLLAGASLPSLSAFDASTSQPFASASPRNVFRRFSFLRGSQTDASNACYILDSGTYDPSCADGFSAVVPLTVPRPTIHYVGSATVHKYLGQISLEISASSLGVKQPYKVCYPLKTKARRCLNGIVDGYDWNSPGVGRLSLTTRGLAATTTFTWFVDGAKVATRTVRAR